MMPCLNSSRFGESSCLLWQQASESFAMQDNAFCRGSIVLLTLHSPRQKFFGLLLELTGAGVALRGVPLDALDDLARQLRAGEAAGPTTLFFPMHRVDQMEIDGPSGDVPSLAEHFAAVAGHSVGELFGAEPKSQDAEPQAEEQR